MSKKVIVVLLIVVGVIGLWFYYSVPCDAVYGWNALPPKACDCKGIKVTTDNSLAVDGSYITQCIGIAISKEVEN